MSPALAGKFLTTGPPGKTGEGEEFFFKLFFLTALGLICRTQDLQSLLWHAGSLVVAVYSIMHWTTRKVPNGEEFFKGFVCVCVFYSYYIWIYD